MKHMRAMDRDLCTMASVDIAATTRTIYASVDCVDCLRRAIVEAEARASALRELLSRAEVVS
jgi:hypothetical protein